MRFLLKYKRALGLIVAIVLLFLSFHDLDRERIGDILSQTNYWYLIPAIIAAFLMNVCKALRWRVIMDPVTKLTFRNIYSIYSVGQMINVSLPALTGQAARVLVLSKQAKLPKTYCATTIIIEVLFDGVSLLIIMLAASTFVVFPGWLARSGILAGIVLVTLAVALLLIVHNRRKLRIYGRRRLKLRFPRLFEKIRHVSKSFVDALDILTSLKHSTLTAIYSLLLWASHALVIVFIIRMFGIDMPIWGALVILVVNSVLLMFPITPGNLGTFQWACIVSMALFGVDKSSAVSFSIILHVMDMIPIFVAGLMFLYFDHLRFRELRDESLKESGQPSDDSVTEEVAVEGE